MKIIGLLKILTEYQILNIQWLVRNYMEIKQTTPLNNTVTEGTNLLSWSKRCMIAPDIQTITRMHVN